MSNLPLRFPSAKPFAADFGTAAEPLLLPPLRTLPLVHPARRAAELRLRLPPLRRISWCPEGPLGACRATVAARLRRDGGRAVAGWLLLIWPGLYIEALCHVVWRTPAGDLVDLSDKYPTDAAKHSVFAFDPELRPGEDAPSRRHRLRASREVDALFEAADAECVARRTIEASIAARQVRLAPGEIWLDHATPAELGILEAYERVIGDALRSCLVLGGC